MRIKKILIGGLIVLAAVTGSTGTAFARQGRGADDPAGHVRHGHGADDGPNHT